MERVVLGGVEGGGGVYAQYSQRMNKYIVFIKETMKPGGGGACL